MTDSTHRPRLTQLKLWMRQATPDEQETLAKRAGTSRGMLYLVSSGHRNFSPEKAAQIERATKVMHRASKGRLPLIYRTDLAAACAGCEYAQKCLGAAAMRAEFPIVGDGAFAADESSATD